MSATDDQIAGEAGPGGNGGDTGRRGRVSDRARAGSPRPPARRLAVLACMDARLDPAKALGLQEGDAHVIRNAGGVATEDALRSLIISQRLLGTEEIVLIHHTNCGMETFSDD